VKQIYFQFSQRQNQGWFQWNWNNWSRCVWESKHCFFTSR